MPIPVPDFGMLEFALSSSLIKDNAELQDGITCQRVFHFLPLSDDGDWNEKSSLRTNVSVLRTRICLQRKQSAQRSAFLLLRVPLLNWIQSAILPQAHPPLWNCTWAFPLWFLASQVVLEVKNLLANAGDAKDAGLIPGSGRAPGVGHGNALQYSFLGNSTDRGAWWATSMWSQRIRHNWAGNTHTHTHTHTHTQCNLPCPTLLSKQWERSSCYISLSSYLTHSLHYCFSIFTHILNYLKEKKRDSYRVSQIHLDSFDYHFNYVFAK